MSPKASKSKGKRDAIVGTVKPADPFELIRWLARSQPDPRKALAELVQNSIDAQARHIEIIRKRDRGVPRLLIRDDGEGVIPDLDRTEALKYLATHVGHSRKRNLTPEQRRNLMMQGKYGIGLLGFWAMGKVLEIRTKVAGEPAFVLRLFEDSSRYEIEKMRSRLGLEDRYTEVVVEGLHRPAFVTFGGRRVADYLASELRGQLLSRDLQIVVHDRAARGRAPKTIEVVPVQYNGRRLDLPEEWPVAGHCPIRVELYLAAEGEEGAGTVSVAASGTVVHDAVTEFETADLRHPPWNDPRLSGLLDFADFQVPPGSRRGVIPDGAAYAFATALRTLAPLVAEQIGNIDQRRAAAVEAGLLRQLARAFRDVPRLAPEYGFFEVRDRRDALPGAPADGGGRTNGAGGSPSGSGDPSANGAAAKGFSDGVDDDTDPEADDPTPLLAGGRLESVQIRPDNARIERLGRRRLHAQAFDAAGIAIRDGIEYHWSCDAAMGHLERADTKHVELVAGPVTGHTEVRVEARQGDTTRTAVASVEIVEPSDNERSKPAGIPDPVFVDLPNAEWRSRMVGEQWEVNSAHPDFIAAAEAPKRKLRFLAALLAKEIVLHSFPGPSFGPALERLVSVLAITERRIG